jgi:hypothetical protein
MMTKKEAARICLFLSIVPLLILAVGMFEHSRKTAWIGGILILGGQFATNIIRVDPDNKSLQEILFGAWMGKSTLRLITMCQFCLLLAFLVMFILISPE